MLVHTELKSTTKKSHQHPGILISDNLLNLPAEKVVAKIALSELRTSLSSF